VSNAYFGAWHKHRYNVHVRRGCSFPGHREPSANKEQCRPALRKQKLRGEGYLTTNEHECCSVRCPQRIRTLRWGQRGLYSATTGETDNTDKVWGAHASRVLVSAASPKRSLSFAPEKSVVARCNDQHPGRARSPIRTSCSHAPVGRHKQTARSAVATTYPCYPCDPWSKSPAFAPGEHPARFACPVAAIVDAGRLRSKNGPGSPIPATTTDSCYS